ncbi:MAG TPA: hypothetical protein VFY83_06765 [Anaerolineales bacterium]|nr:hypothetical protein [Anaerolineales bacterium]
MHRPEDPLEISILSEQRYRKRTQASAWEDTSLTWLEVIALIGTVPTGIYSFITLFGG